MVDLVDVQHVVVEGRHIAAVAVGVPLFQLVVLLLLHLVLHDHLFGCLVLRRSVEQTLRRDVHRDRDIVLEIKDLLLQRLRPEESGVHHELVAGRLVGRLEDTNLKLLRRCARRIPNIVAQDVVLGRRTVVARYELARRSQGQQLLGGFMSDDGAFACELFILVHYIK